MVRTSLKLRRRLTGAFSFRPVRHKCTIRHVLRSTIFIASFAPLFAALFTHITQYLSIPIMSRGPYHAMRTCPFHGALQARKRALHYIAEILSARSVRILCYQGSMVFDRVVPHMVVGVAIRSERVAGRSKGQPARFYNIYPATSQCHQQPHLQAFSACAILVLQNTKEERHGRMRTKTFRLNDFQIEYIEVTARLRSESEASIVRKALALLMSGDPVGTKQTVEDVLTRYSVAPPQAAEAQPPVAEGEGADG